MPQQFDVRGQQNMDIFTGGSLIVMSRPHQSRVGEAGDKSKN